MSDISITSESLRTFRASGMQDDGSLSETVITIVRNPEWCLETRDDEYRYHIHVYVDGDESNSDTADTKTDAVTVAESFLSDAIDAYDSVSDQIAEERGEALLSACEDWYEGDDSASGADRSAVEHVAAQITLGKGRAILAALRAAGLAD
jgi:hypothetical protein